MRNFILTFFGLLVLYGCSGHWSDYPEQKTTSNHEKQAIIGVGDIVNLSVFNESDLSGDYTVLQDGSIQVPLIGAIHINDMELNNAANLIAKTLKSKGYLINPKVTLSIAQSQTVKILGEIQKSGEYVYTDDITILGLVAKAGGFSYRARQDRFDIIRKNGNETEQILKGQISTRLEPGDIIRVGERYF